LVSIQALVSIQVYKYKHIQHKNLTFLFSNTSYAKIFAGVGLPPSQQKILSGMSFSFSPQYHVPALIPSFEIPDCMKVDYVAKLTVGRSQNENPNSITYISMCFKSSRLYQFICTNFIHRMVARE
uniref:MSP domain-containing protein n=1 Tax=Ascaris lumbricoides TaxID=6252 RepID=A0A0M3HJK4_ASCLU